jgi:YesN/AraC family two-component response regulator
MQIEGIIEYLNYVGQIIIETHNKLLFMEFIDAPAKIPLIKKFVKENYMKKITLPDTAKKFFLSPDYFGHFFKKEVGVSFMCFVNMYRIAQAEEMLKKTSRNISEIAFMTGFGSLSQFNRAFKDINGISPRDFRKK